MSNDNDDNNGTRAKKLLADAHQQGFLSRASVGALEIVDLGAQIQAGLGVGIDDVSGSEVLLVTIMPDDSGSISAAGNAAAVREGHNLVLDALAASTQAAEVFVHTRYLNGSVLTPYTSLAQAVRMTPQNYDPRLATPLHDQAVVLFGTVLAKAQEMSSAGIAVRTVTLLITDGGDCSSQHHRACDVKAIVDDLLMQENHVVAALGISDGSTDFRQVFQSMGIPDSWILTPGQSAGDIRRAFQLFSQSAAKVGGGGAMPASLGGFAN